MQWVSNVFSSMVKTKLIESNWTRVRTTASRAQKKKGVCDKSIRDGKAQKANGAYKNHCGAVEARRAHNPKDG